MIKIKYQIKSKKEAKKALLLIKRAESFYGTRISCFLDIQNYIILYDSNIFSSVILKQVYGFKVNVNLKRFKKYILFLLKNKKTTTYTSFIKNYYF